ncbi:ATP-binding cassette domain-containing protein [Marinoscillum furvescens]|uniref:ABC-type multidrug transport system ATPase subunit n=1 Tax=Marinoscillum furvescens DSM 4134 TaxID=1122208 RepID=A0A3D9L3J7_MARFU|nr:ATP-binding cassette domain-containing protein [Marinoscillum furvescens]RED97941.1 ABC-type multidrug transport system ATPase subunit [Marinoscillum furvescens DSM 4134]
MSEEILRAIVELLAIVAKEDEVTADERASIQNFLEDNLTQDSSIRFLSLFDELTANAHSPGDEAAHISEICMRINQEQTSQQKIIIILNLIIVINADGRISERENELLYLISDHLNIDKRLTDLIKAFVIFQERSKISSRNLMIVDDGNYQIPEKCQRIIRPEFDGFILILRIPNEEVYLAKYVGEHNPVLNEIPMRTNRIYNLASGSSIKFESSDPLYHSEIVNRFRSIAAEHHLTFVADQVSFKFKNGNIGLRNINIQEEGGQLIALMGGSGAGKSTLLNVLNGNDKPSEGSVRVNGVDIHVSPKKIDGVIGYVPQDDLLIEELTVFDNLYYAAKLCFKDLSGDEISELVNKTLESLGLYETRHLKVGSPLEKTISGGQRKRLNIGLELLREPSLLYVDEPTSGLSSRDSENIMDLLKELSLKGKMVFVVIHQPSEDIFKMFDKLIVLDVGGYQVYYGNPIEGISYFKQIVKMVDQSRTANPEQIFNIIESKVINEFGNFTKERKTSPEQWYAHFKEKIKLPKIKETDVIPHKTLHLPSHLKQLGIFTIRDLKSKLSNKQYLLINLLEAPILALLLAFIIRYMPEDTTTYHFSENLNIPVFFFMSVIVSLFMGLTVSAEEIIKDRKILKREAFLHLSRSSYLYSKLIILFSISAFQTATYLALGHWILEIKGMFLPFWLVLFSTSCFANLLGLNISAAFKSAVTVYILIPLLVIPQLILSGVVVNFDKLNPSITTEDKVPMIGEVMASRWAFEALAVHQFKSNAFNAMFYPQDKQMAESEFKTVYTFPRLEDDLEYIHHNIAGASEEEREIIAYKLTTLRNELNKELSKIGYDKFPQVDQLTLSNWSDELFDDTKEFLGKLVTYYNLRFKKANSTKQSKLKELTSSPEQRQVFNELKQDHHNEAVAQLVKNVATAHRILEHNNELVQKLYPIYHDPEFPDHVLDVRAQFYQPQKHFAGMYIDTLYFNVTVIWLMSIFLFVALYFDWLKKIVN